MVSFRIIVSFYICLFIEEITNRSIMGDFGMLVAANKWSHFTYIYQDTHDQKSEIMDRTCMFVTDIKRCQSLSLHPLLEAR